jgi:16S rRNA (cytidine1402-2'-O)-methyltransferase
MSEGGVSVKGLERLGGFSPNLMDPNGGCLFLVATPIGNLEDISFRAIRILQEADLIAAEDTRHSRKLLTHFEISTPLTSYHEHNKHSKGLQLIEHVIAGKKIALITDAGMPGISDPGHELVVLAWQAELPVVVIPGPSAGILALVASGFKTNRFVFEGFLSTEKKVRSKQLKSLSAEQGTTVLYEAPHRLKKTLEELASHLGDRKIVIARELTKKFEEIVKGTAPELVEYFQQKGIKGEFVLVIEGGEGTLPGQSGEWWAELSLEAHVEFLIREGQTKKEAIKEVAKVRNLPKREVYQAVLPEK